MKESIISQLAAFTKGVPRHKRGELAQVIGEICRYDEGFLSQKEMDIAFSILGQLIEVVESKVRRSLSERLCKRPDVPRDLVLFLANDEIDIATPILTTSPVLLGADLIAICLNCSRWHRLAVAARPNLPDEVTDVLIGTGETDTIKRLLQNNATIFGDKTLQKLLNVSRSKTELQPLVIVRPELSGDLAREMYSWVGDRLRQAIITRFGTSVAERVEGDIKFAVESGVAAEPSEVSISIPVGPLFDNSLARLERELRALTHLESEIIYQIFESSPKAFAAACRAAGIRIALFERLICAKYNYESVQQLRSSDSFAPVFKYFDQLSEKEAKTLVIKAALQVAKRFAQ